MAGRAASEQYKLIDKQLKSVGSQIGERVKELSKTTKVPISDSVQQLDSVLADQGIRTVIDTRDIRTSKGNSRRQYSRKILSRRQ